MENNENKEVKEKSLNKRRYAINIIAANAIVAALYAVITIACGPLSYEFMQLRFSELLNLLVFFNPSYTIGVTIGCLIANLFSSVGPIDIVIGTASTLVSCLLIWGFSKLTKNLLFSGFIPCLVNAITVPLTIYLSCLGTGEEFVLTFGMYMMMFGWVFLGEFICIIVVGYPIFLILPKRVKAFSKMILANQNLDFKW